MRNTVYDGENKSELSLYDSHRSVRTQRGRAVSFDSAWSSGIEGAFSLVGVVFVPDATDGRRWILRNDSKRSLYVQHPSFGSPVCEVAPGNSIALVEGSRITGSPRSKWVNVAIAQCE